jgi:type II restriction/modification system DNA methylase subunit YeeA
MLIVRAVIIEPLQREWAQTKARLVAEMEKADARKGGAGTKALNAATAIHLEFLERLKGFRVLDPACGSGNFLNLSLLALKDIEHRANLEAETLGLERHFPGVGPENVLGIELNPYAAELARVSVWIGEIQWMRRNGFDASRNPVLRPLHTIENRDAVLNEDGTQATWPDADVIVGNPPFLGTKKQYSELGKQYTDIMRAAYSGRVPGFADLVCYWFEKANDAIRAGKAQRAGLVATNSIRGGANREVLTHIVETTRIFEAWADEAWVNEGAAVRVSLVCFGNSDQNTRLDGQPVAEIFSDLNASDGKGGGVDLTGATKLQENEACAFVATVKAGAFDIPGTTARSWLKLPNPNGRNNSNVLRPWANGMDVTRRPSDTWIIDYGVDTPEADAALYEMPFAHVLEHVKPLRDKSNRAAYKMRWWRLAEPIPAMRLALAPLSRFIATVVVSKHRLFVWMDARILPDHALIAIARDDDTTLGILHSRIHELWSLRMCTWLGVGNDPRYTPTTCFETFPFPEHLTPKNTKNGVPDTPQAKAIADAAKHLDTLRNNWLNPPEWTDWVITPEEEKANYPKRPIPKPGFEADLKKRTLTNLYNQRPAWLDMAHKTLDKAVATAYGWTDYIPNMPDDEILARLFRLNKEREV